MCPLSRCLIQKIHRQIDACRTELMLHCWFSDGVKAQYIAWLAVQVPADRFQRIDSDGLCLSVF